MKYKILLLLIHLIVYNALSQDAENDTMQLNDLNNLAWLSGYWTSDSDNIKMEEFWLDESNGVMLGLHRDSFSNEKVFYEYLKIVQEDEGIYYYASPMGKTPTKFKLKLLKVNHVVFENPDHDFPQRVIYTLEGDTLIARIEGIEDGKTKSSEWKWFKSDF